MCFPQAAANHSWLVRFCTKGHRARLAVRSRLLCFGAFRGGSVLLIQVPSLASRANSALVTDAFRSLRLAYGAAKRER